MKTNPGYYSYLRFCLTMCHILAVIFVPVMALGAGGIIDQSIDALYNLRDQNQANAMKSVKGVADAMQDGPPPDPGAGQPWTRDDLEKIRAKNANLLKLNNDLAHYQNEMFKNDTDLLQKLPPNDPRRAEVEAHRQKIASDLNDTRSHQQLYRGKVSDANTAIDSWRRAHDPDYIPPKTTSAPSVAPAQSDQPVDSQPPSEPPKSNNPPGNDTAGGGDADNGLTGLKQKEAEKEAAARALGKDRVSAVNRYLDDPSDENRQAAEALRHQLDGMVDDLNGIRDQVDQLEGTSRTHVHVRSAKSIAEEHRKNKASGTNTDGTTTAGACGGSGTGSGSGMEQHNPDGSDVSGNTYQDVASGRGATGSSASNGAPHSGRRSQHSHSATHQHSGTNMTSSESHHHGAAMNTTNQQNMAQTKRRQQLQQQQQQQQLQQQRQIQQQRRRHPNGY